MSLKNLFFSPQIKDLVAYSVLSLDWEEIIRDRKAFPVNRALLKKKLRAQNERNLFDAVERNIERLGEENTFTVTTGHQLVLGTGPLYVIYKTFSVIALCKQLQRKYPDYHFVPVFWLASEDHDYQEVHHFFIDFRTKIEYQGGFEGAVGRHIVQPEALPSSPSIWVTEAYQQNHTWKQAFQHTLSSIFYDHGLVFIDGDDPDLKREFSPYFLKEIQERRTYQNVKDTNDVLHQLGIKRQWEVSEVNLFYLTDKKREKIHFRDGEYFIGSRRVERDFLWRELEGFPERFSPNAGFRPLYQEFLLPNLAYVGGWAELNYWLQLKKNFEDFGIFYPLLLPRFSYTYFPQEVLAGLKEWGYSPDFILLPLKTIRSHIAMKYFDFQPLQNQFNQIQGSIGDIQDGIRDLSETLAASLGGSKLYWEKVYRRLEGKLIKVIQNRYPKEFYEIYRMKERVQPDGFIQERVLNISAFVRKREDLPGFMRELEGEVEKWAAEWV